MFVRAGEPAGALIRLRRKHARALAPSAGVSTTGVSAALTTEAVPPQILSREHLPIAHSPLLRA